MAAVDTLVSVLTGTSAYHAELRTLGMAFQGAMAVRDGPNKDKSMNWFHAFCLLTVVAFGGGWFSFLWMGKPTSLITGGDVTLTICMICFVLTTYTPVYNLGTLLPFKVLYTVWAQLFRAMGMLAFIDTCNAEVSASKYYPTPVLGPVLYGSLLGNMGAFFLKGFNGHLEKDIPWPFQNGESAHFGWYRSCFAFHFCRPFCLSSFHPSQSKFSSNAALSGIVMGLFYQLYANDKVGILGVTLRSVVQGTGIQGGFSDQVFACLVVSIFMQATGILMLPEFLGPSWSPFMGLVKYVTSIVDGTIAAPTTVAAPVMQAEVTKINTSNRTQQIAEDELDEEPATTSKKKRKSKKKKTQ